MFRKPQGRGSKNLVLAGLLAITLLFSGCFAASQITADVKEKAGVDLTRTSELAAKYGRPEVKKCTDFLLASLNSEDVVKAKLDELLKEPTAGLASAGLKAALIVELGRSLNDPAQRQQFESAFKTNCSAVAGDIFLNILRDSRTVATRGAR